jgi:hypothetical protein
LRKTLDVSIRGYFFMSVEAGKLMRENGGAASSTWSRLTEFRRG